LSFDFPATLRRLKPQKRIRPLSRRADAELSFVDASPSAGAGLLLDTSVYIDALQARLPVQVKALLSARQSHHSAIAVAELSHAFGRLDPSHADTAGALAEIEGVIGDIPDRRLTGPSVRAFVEAGIVTGIIARARGLSKTDRQPLFNDACLFLQALEDGLHLLTRNVGDMDLIQQLVPAGRILLYRQAT
jgi:predicted nucleic acid-binding protein